MEQILKLVAEALDCPQNQIKLNCPLEDNEGWDSLSAIVLHEILIEHYNLIIAVEELGEYSVEGIKELI